MISALKLAAIVTVLYIDRHMCSEHLFAYLMFYGALELYEIMFNSLVIVSTY